MKYNLWIPVCLLLAGCAHYVPEVKTQRVYAPVEVSCQAEAVPEPKWAFPALPATASYGDKVRAALGDLALAKGYTAELRSQMAACR